MCWTGSLKVIYFKRRNQPVDGPCEVLAQRIANVLQPEQAGEVVMEYRKAGFVSGLGEKYVKELEVARVYNVKEVRGNNQDDSSESNQQILICGNDKHVNAPTLSGDSKVCCV